MEGRKKKEKLRDIWREVSVVEQSYIIVQICIYMYYVHLCIYNYSLGVRMFIRTHKQNYIDRHIHQ